MSTYVKLQKQIEALQAEAEQVLADEKAGKISEVRAIIQTYSLTPQEVFGRGGSWKGKSTTREKNRAPAFGDSNGNTWGGRGPRPQWLRDALSNGSSLEDFKMQGKQMTESPARPRRSAAKKVTARKVGANTRKTVPRKAASKKSAASSAGASKAE
jgi:DNA-binding protein H-NS